MVRRRVVGCAGLRESMTAAGSNAHFLARRGDLKLSQDYPVPSPGTQPPLYKRLVCDRAHLFATPVAQSVAVEAGRDDVLPAVTATIFPGMQMLGSALKFSALRVFEIESASEVVRISEPHWLVAVVATSILLNVCGFAGFSRGSACSVHCVS